MRVAVAVALLILVAAAVWLVLESRYRSCIERAEAMYPIYGERTAFPGDTRDVALADRAAAVEDCSRLSF